MIKVEKLDGYIVISNGISSIIISKNDRWITIKRNHENKEEKGRHLLLEDGETPADAIKRQWGVDVNKKKSGSSKQQDGATEEQKKAIKDLLDNGYYGKLSKEYVSKIKERVGKNLDEYPKVISVINEIGSIQGVSRHRKQTAVEEYKEKIEKSINDTLDFYKSMYSDVYIERNFGGIDNLKEKIKTAVERKYKKANELRAGTETAHYEWMRYRDEPENKGKGGLHFNEKYTLDNIGGASLIAESTGYHPIKCDSIDSIIDHEFGHAFERYIIQNIPNSESYKKIGEIYEKSLIDGEIESNLSKYAKSNLSEFIAEGYSEYKNNPNPRALAKQIGRLLEKAYKEAENG